MIYSRSFFVHFLNDATFKSFEIGEIRGFLFHTFFGIIGSIITIISYFYCPEPFPVTNLSWRPCHQHWQKLLPPSFHLASRLRFILTCPPPQQDLSPQLSIYPEFQCEGGRVHHKAPTIRPLPPRPPPSSKTSGGRD